MTSKHFINILKWLGLQDVGSRNIPHRTFPLVGVLEGGLIIDAINPPHVI